MVIIEYNEQTYNCNPLKTAHPGETFIRAIHLKYANLEDEATFLWHLHLHLFFNH